MSHKTKEATVDGQLQDRDLSHYLKLVAVLLPLALLSDWMAQPFGNASASLAAVLGSALGDAPAGIALWAILLVAQVALTLVAVGLCWVLLASSREWLRARLLIIVLVVALALPSLHWAASSGLSGVTATAFRATYFGSWLIAILVGVALYMRRKSTA